jgi:hypothetical protein
MGITSTLSRLFKAIKEARTDMPEGTMFLGNFPDGRAWYRTKEGQEFTSADSPHKNDKGDPPKSGGPS